jgi:hypothetical protein
MTRTVLMVALAIVALHLTPSSVGQPASERLQIVGFEGDRHCIHLRRGSSEISPDVLTELAIGDIITLVCDAAVLLESSSGKVERVGVRQAPYVVRTASSVPQNDMFLQQLGIKLSKAYDELRSGVALGEGSQLALTIPGLATRNAKIKLGVRRFSLEWTGGRAPYTVAVADRFGRLVRPMANTKTSFVTFSEPMNLQSGEYFVTISSSDGMSVRGAFSAIDQLPPISLAVTGPSIPPQSRRVIQAIALAEMDREAWSFEAYLQVCGADQPLRDLSPLEQLARAYVARQGSLQ